MLLLQDQEKALDKYEDVVRGLQRRGVQVVPLKYRRETPLKPIPVEALCDFEGDQVSHYLTPGSLDLQHRCLRGSTGRTGATSNHVSSVSLSVHPFSWAWICTRIFFPSLAALPPSFLSAKPP